MEETKEDVYDWLGGFTTLRKEMLSPIGKGAFGEVFICKDSSGEEYAAKRVVMNKSNNAYPYLLNEIELLKKISDFKIKNAVGFYGAFEKSEKQDAKVNIGLIFELCKGGSLEDAIIDHGNLSEMDIKNILYPVVLCFNDLHEHHIIHRDLKPNNILFASSKRWKPGKPAKIRICDFGISILTDNSAAEAVSKVGTMENMAPEIFKHIPYYGAVDVFAFGITLYRLLYDDVPFPGQSIQSWDNDGIIAIPKTRHVSAQCFDLLQWCLRKYPDKRPTFSQIKKHPFFSTEVRDALPLLLDEPKGILFYNLKDEDFSYCDRQENEGSEGNEKDDLIATFNKKLLASSIKSKQN